MCFKTTLILLLFRIILVSSEPNNVCSSFMDYMFLQTSPYCWYDPDVDSNIYQILGRRNIPLEEYNLKTSDGYILTTFRMKQPNLKSVVLLSHSMTNTANSWFNHGNNSLALTLYNAGYEVWLSNNRGSYYSRVHENKSSYSFNYWDFSFHEMGAIDLPLQLDLIKNITKRNDIIYVGYSLSTTTSVVYASLFPEHAKNSVKLFILLAPSVYVASNKIIIPKSQFFREVQKKLGLGSVSFSYTFTKNLIKKVCGSHPFKILCVLASEGFTGLDNLDPATLPFLYSQYMSRMALKIFIHTKQNTDANRFQFYDYGPEENLIRYNSTIPPLYPIEKINVPMYFIYGGKDTLATPMLVERFYGELPEQVKIYGKRFIPEFTHYDFRYAKQYKDYICGTIVNLLNNLK